MKTFIISLIIGFLVQGMVAANELVDDLGDIVKRNDDKREELERRVLRKFGEKDSQSIENEQKAWLEYREHTCSMRKKSVDDNDLDRKQASLKCLRKITELRIKRLEDMLASTDVTEHKPRNESVSRCQFEKMPGDYRVYYVYQTDLMTKSRYKVAGTSTLANSSDIYLDNTDKPVYLVLISSQPIVWHIYRNKNVELSGIIVSGNTTSALLGVEKKVPVIDATKGNKKHCAYINPSRSFDVMEAAVFSYVKRKIDYFPNENVKDKVVFGERLEASQATNYFFSQERSIDDYHGFIPVLQPSSAIERLLAENKIRKATKQDIMKWVEIAKQTNNSTKHRMNLNHTYFINTVFSLPPDMPNTAMVSFIAKNSSLYPENIQDFGLSSFFVYNLENGTCFGFGCVDSDPWFRLSGF